ncbi:hypothetical protein LPJ77_006192 [Coemansia sp. RSA 2523]|nr:hypothetical protein LPJ69_005054 [Coemansia sp. RSA 1752]KAJ1759984.1 hypothetical protein LPJ54_006163 [Coemansia sp. RSA 1824]KAJ1782773.1 hypothetical protein LPJ67_004971 [Coemansia sp. RSA 1938]KAJ1800150.1 hypothetical protein LPJ77_006192 [Coemansia sp. RSA 2523]KAJ2140003.1 hypothetical protein GGH17_000022 [Coemansia sp. RSA 788]KAJ2168919.1 hypothetical protein GGH15_000973 [Coemansia sp. RSA 562]KAJ2182730.1 hypothetical protein GGF45_000604 [Coemansia sp. RSA 551]KAJ2191640.1
MSDIGTLKELTNGLLPLLPYWNGRFSSGPVWNEYLALLLGYNHYSKSLGGSTSDNTHSMLTNDYNLYISSTQEQISYFRFTNLLYKQDKTRDQDIAILEVGANDYFAEVDNLASGSLSISSFTDTLSTTVVDQLEQLRKIGFKNIVVANMGAIQYTPMAIQANQQDFTKVIVDTYNTQLTAKANAWAKTAADVDMFAICDFGKFIEVTASSQIVIEALGLTNVTGACLDTLDTSSSKATIAARTNVPNESVCIDPSRFYFFDNVHPAERIQRLFGYYNWMEINAQRQGKVFEPTESNLLLLIKTYKLGTPAPKPAAI